MKGLIFVAEDFFKKHGTTVLTILGSVGLVGTAVLSSKATIKAIDILEKDNIERSKKEIIKETWTCFVPALLVGVASIACVSSANILNKRSQAQLTSAFMLLNSSFDIYKDRLKHLYGEEAHNNIIDSIVKESVSNVYIYTPELCGNSTLVFDTKNPDEVRTFYDAYSQRYFESTIEKVLQAEYHLNRNHILGGASTLNDFYSFLGIAPVEGGDEIGWESYYTEIYWVDFNHSVVTLDDGMEICTIDFLWSPEPFAYE